MEKQGAGLRKHQQINRTNKVMFIWIAGVSVIVGFSAVLIVFLAQRILFGEKVIAAKNDTVSVLQKNLDTVSALRDNVRVLNTNEALASTRLSDSDSALQSVLDALPADANSTAMASSLQERLLSGIPGVTIQSLNVDPVNSDGSSTSDSSSTGASGGSTSHTIGFSFSVSTALNNQKGLRQVLLNIEKSIRPFNITNLSVESQGSQIVMTVSGVGYYDSAQTVQLTDKVVHP